jgi:SAM-dependent methyltransferase
MSPAAATARARAADPVPSAALDDLATEPGACALCGRRDGAVVAAGPDFEYDTTRVELAFHRCACGGVYLDPRPAPAALARIYPPTYYAYDFARKLGRVTRRFKAMAERAKVRAYLAYLRPGARVLDVGCADGLVLDQLRRHAGMPLELEGVELSADAAAMAERAGFRVHRGRIETVGLPAGAYDLVIMNQLIEHVADPAAVLEAVARALAPGGHVFVETPNLDAWDARLFRRRYWGGYHLPRHFHLFDTRTLPALARRAGLEPVALVPLVCPQFWIISLHNWLADRGRRALAARLFDPLNPVLLAPFTLVELVQQRVGWTANLRLVARRSAA